MPASLPPANPGRADVCASASSPKPDIGGFITVLAILFGGIGAIPLVIGIEVFFRFFMVAGAAC